MNALKTATILLMACFISCSARGETNECLRRTVPLNIIAWKPAQLPALTSSSLDVYLKANELTLDSVSLDQNPRRILILVDVSGSFLAKYDWVTYLTTDLLEHIPPPNEIGLASFSESLDLLVSPTTDHEQISHRIATAFTAANVNLPPKHRQTALWDAVRGSVSLLGPHHVGDVILVITDGMDNWSKTKAEGVRDSLLAEGIRLFTIDIINQLDFVRTSIQSQDSVAMMGSIADATGGLIINPLIDGESPPTKAKTSPQVRALLNIQYGQILTFYRVEIALPHAIDKEFPLKLYLAGLDNSTQKKFELRYPKFLVPCN